MVNIGRDFFIMLKNLQQMHLKLLQKKTFTGDLICNKIANKITGVSKNSQQNNSETVTNEQDKEVPKEKYLQKKGKKSLMN